MVCEKHFSQADSSAVVPEPTTSRRLGEGERRNDPTITRANRATNKDLEAETGNVLAPWAIFFRPSCGGYRGTPTLPLFLKLFLRA